MSNRENYIDGVRIYSDNFEDENNKASKKVTTYKKVEATTTTTRIKKEGDKPAQTTTTTTKRSRIQKDLGIPRNSINTINGGIQEFIDSVEGKKEKIVYKGKLKEKSNYLYYVSGIGYVDKDGVPAKKDNKPKEIVVTKKKPKPVREVGKRVTITIQNVRPERKGGELIENFNYYESKNIDERNRESIVIHRRLGDPFYQAIGQGRRSSYNPGHRGRYVLDKEEIGTKVDTSKTRTIETKTTQRNRFENKTYNTTQATRQTNQSGTGRNVRKTVETKTVKVEERKRNIDSNNNRRQKPTESGSAPQKVYDTEKYKRNDNQDKYQKKAEEAQKTLESQEENIITEPNYCPIHGYKGMNISYDEIDNYKFYESKHVTKRIDNANINTNVNTYTQNLINSEENINTINQEQMTMAQAQAQAQSEEGYDLSRLYVATKVTPVYSEMIEPHEHVCYVCGNPFDENQMDMMQQQGQMNNMQMQEMEYDINCPIHGQNRNQ